jgi:hypothetical protein
MTEPKHARDMTEAEREAWWSEHRRKHQSPMQPLPEKHARDMTPEERETWWSEHRRKFQ